MGPDLLLSVFIFLAAACVLVPLAKLTGLGSVIGYLIAGVLIGPHVLGLISEPATILHFSEFGVVMMLFLIGLELKPSHLWEMRVRLLGLGGLQVGITAAAITGVAIALDLPLGTAIAVGLGLSLSSTAIAVQIMQDRGMMATVSGRSGFSVLLFQDVIVIAMIAVMPFLVAFNGDAVFTPEMIEAGEYGVESHGAGHQDGESHGSGYHGPNGLMRLIAIFGVFGGMILTGRLLLRPLFRVIARSGVRETFTVIALLLVVGAALLMEWLSLSAALGAFIAGVVLADSEYRHQLERDIEPFKALLLGLFFMSVGMSLNLGMLAKEPLLIFGLVGGLMAIKFIILMIIGMVFRLERSSNILFACLLCQAGEFGFVLFQFASGSGLLSTEIATRMNAVIALSMAFTPMIILGFDKFITPMFRAPAPTGDHPVDENNTVLVLGFGRVGQVASRLLHTQDIATTIIDHDGDHIEFVKQFGNRVFYGDAADVDLLRAAGADSAEVIILAIDNVQKSIEAAHAIKAHFPKARIVARARNRSHMFELLAENVDYAERETVRGALAMGRSTLEFLGYSPEKAQQLSNDFLEHDFKIIKESYHLRDDMNALIQQAEKSRIYIKETLNADKAITRQGTAEKDFDD